MPTVDKCKKCGTNNPVNYGFCDGCFKKLFEGVYMAHERFHEALDSGPQDTAEEQANFHDFIVELWKVFRDEPFAATLQVPVDCWEDCEACHDFECDKRKASFNPDKK